MLQPKELELIQNSDFFHLKKSAIGKINAELTVLKNKIQHTPLNQNIIYPEGTDTELGKISKGENYKGLPYLILDYPRLFTQEGVLAFRTMFWWANGFYFTFHLSGEHLTKCEATIEKVFDLWQNHDIFYYHFDDEWQHEVQSPYYFPIENISKADLKEIMHKQGYLKLARRLTLDKADELVNYGLQSFLLFFFCLME